MDGISALGMFFLILRHIISQWLMGIFSELLCNDSYCKLRKKKGGMVSTVWVDSRKEGHSLAVHGRSASWDTHTALVSLTCHCRVLKMDRFFPVFNLLSLPIRTLVRWPRAAGWAHAAARARDWDCERGRPRRSPASTYSWGWYHIALPSADV